MNCHVTTLTITREKIWQQIKNGINSIKIMEYLTAIIWICVRAMNCAPRRDHVPFCIVEAALDKGSMLWVFRHDATHPSSDWHNNLEDEDQPFVGNLCLSKRYGRLQYNFCESPDPWTLAGLTPMISSRPQKYCYLFRSVFRCDRKTAIKRDHASTASEQTKFKVHSFTRSWDNSGY